jgi:hypothetical protein
MKGDATQAEKDLADSVMSLKKLDMGRLKEDFQNLRALSPKRASRTCKCWARLRDAAIAVDTTEIRY